MMDRRSLIKDLIALTGRSASSFASEIGVHRSNLYTWLKRGGRDVGLDAQGRLLDKLGVSGGTLSSSRVHFWTLKSGDLSPLVRILSWASTATFEVVYLAPENLVYRTPDPPPIAIYNSEKKIRILFRRRLDPLTPGNSAIDSLVPSGRSKWKDDPFPGIVPASDLVLRVDSKVFDNWMEGNFSVEEYDRILGSGKATTAEGESSQEAIIENRELAKKLLKLRHQSITSVAKTCGLNPSNVASWLKGIPGRLSQEKQNVFLEYLGISVGETPSPHVVHSWEAFCAEMVLRGIRPEEALSIIDRVRKGKS